MTETINCGKFLDTLKKISDALFKGFDKLIDLGMKFDDKIDEPEDGVKVFHVTTGKGKKFDIKVTENGNDVYDLYAKVDGFKSLDVKKVRADKISKVICDYVDDVLGESVEDATDNDGNDLFSSSDRCIVSLKKVTAGKDVEVHLISINCSIDPSVAMNNIQTVLNNDSFVSQLAEEPKTFSIIDEGDNLDVTECSPECANSSDYILNVFSAAKATLDYVRFIHWNAKGDHMRDIHNMTDGFIWSLQSQMDMFAELQVELFDSMPNPSTLNIECDCSEVDTSNVENVYSSLRDCLNQYADTIEFYYCDFSFDIQSRLDDMIRDWRKQANYFIKQTNIRSTDNEIIPSNI